MTILTSLRITFRKIRFLRKVISGVLLFQFCLPVSAWEMMPPAICTKPPAIVLDAHEDSLRLMLDNNLHYGQNMIGNHGDTSKWKKGGLNVVWLAAWVNPARYIGQDAVDRTFKLIDTYKSNIRASNGMLAACSRYSEVIDATNRRQIALLLAVEGGISLDNDPSLLQQYRDLGVRRLNLAWNDDLEWAGAALGNAQKNGQNEGLSAKGKIIVKEMNRLGIIVDLSHASDQTIRDTLSITNKPVICSHSNVRTLSSSARNLPDDLIKRIAKNDGVIGINFYPPHLKSASIPNPNVKTVADHIQYVYDLVGVNHVGIGSDWDGIEITATGLEDASKLPALFAELRLRGFTKSEIDKIAGGNFLRVLKANE